MWLNSLEQMYEKARIINSGGLESSLQNKRKPPKKKITLYEPA